MKNKNISELTEQYNNYIYPKPTENLSEEWIKKNRFQICDPNYCWHRLWPEKPYNTKRLDILMHRPLTCKSIFFKHPLFTFFYVF